MDECLNAEKQERALCPDDKRCANTEGSYDCVDACEEGFQADPSDSLGPCIDVDECLHSIHNCTLAEK